MKVKRILSALLALALISGMMSTGVFAAEVTVIDEAGLKEALVAGGEVALGADVEVNEMIVIPEGVTATLDLAGWNITSKYDESTEKHIYPIANRGTLTIKDTVGTGSISGRGVYNASTSSSDTVSADAKLTVDGAKIVAEDYNGGACIWSRGGEVYVNNATFVGYAGCVYSEGYLEINGGTYTCYSGIDDAGNQVGTPTYNIRAYNGLKITDGEFTSRHGVLYLGGGECIIEDGSYTIEFKAALTSNVVFIYGTADVTIEDGEFISDNSANVAESGAAVLVDGTDAKLEINGGTYVGMNGMVSGNTNTVINAGSFSTVFDYNHYGSIDSYIANGAEVTVGGVSYTKTESGLINTPPKAEVTRLEAMTLTAEEHEYMCWPSGDATVDRPLEIVMNFKALETAEEVESSYYKEYLTDFYLTINGLSSDSITADGCYLAGNYGDFGWIVIPTDGTELENGGTYPIVSAYDATLNYKDICTSVQNFTAAIHIDEAILDANPNMTVELELRMTNPEDPTDVLTIGEPATYTAAQLRGEPQAEVTRLEALTLTADEHQVWDGSLHAGTEEKPLEIVVNFKALETAEEVKYSPWKAWKVDFYLTLEDLAGNSITADNCYLAGNYGTFGWIVIPTDGLELEEGVTYPVVSAYDANITYKQICDSVKDFTSAIHIDEAILNANPDMKVKLELKITNPDNASEVFTIGDPLIYTAAQLRGEPQAEVTRLEALTLTADEHQVWDGSLHAGTEEKPLEIVVNFKALETAEEVKYSPWKAWKVDFYLTLEDLAGNSITADNCYLAGNYGTFGWIVIPTDGMELEDGVTYPVVSAYDANITYKQICDSVKDFTAAIHVDQAILDANPDMKVKLELKITNPDNASEVFTIGDPIIYTVDDLKNAEEEVEKFDLEGSNITLGNNLDMHFYVAKDNVSTEDYAIITHYFADDSTEQIRVNISECGSYNNDKWYQMTLKTLAARHMSDKIEVVMYDADGVQISNIYTDSIRDYALRLIEHKSIDEITKIVAVDMINYGTEAQLYFDYSEDDLANKNIDDYQHLATGDITVENILSKGDNYYGSVLSLEGNILMKVYFSGISDAMKDEMEAVISYTSHLGVERNITVKGSSFERGNSTAKAVVVNTLSVADASRPVTITVYNSDGTVYGTATDSVESIVERSQKIASADVAMALAKFAVSAHNNFHK